MLLQPTRNDHSVSAEIHQDAGHVGRWVVQKDLERLAFVRSLLDKNDSLAQVGDNVGYQGWLLVFVGNPEEDHHHAKEDNHGKVDP